MSENTFVSDPDQPSFLQTRDPSIWGWDQRIRFVAPVRKQLFNEVLEEESNAVEPNVINTYLRLKPAPSTVDQATLTILNDTTVVANAPKNSATFKNKISGRVVHQYSFSKVLGPDTTQKEVFDECVAYQVKDFILGSNCLLFAYGTTNAGKTFTIQGNGSSPGVIPRSLDMLFKTIRGQVAGVGKYKPDKVEGILQLDSNTISQELDYKNRILHWTWDKPLEPIKSGTNNSSCNLSSSSESDFISSTFREMQKTLSNDSPVDMSNEGDVVYGVWVSFAEVYNENIYDLLDPIMSRNRKRIPLKMAQDGEGITFIRDLKMIHVSSGDEAFHVMLYGKANLQVAATNMNSHSSRSHCIFTIRLVRYANSDDPSYAIVSSFTFCDLAGAERAKKTLNAGDRLKESNNINTSLHVLGRCLATIRENQKKKERKPVPFRDSKLTRIFQRALTGHERITMIVNANTSSVLFDETVNVLKFSAIAKQIVLETPIKKSKPPTKKSRFSIMVSRPNPHGTICWDAPPQDDSTSDAGLSTDTIQKYNAQNEELIMLVERLKEQLAEEREKNLTLERSVRQKVTETFSKIISDMENSWKSRVRDMEERNESLSAWRLTQLENYYKQCLEGARKRPRESDADDSIVECNSPKADKRVKELEEEVQLLEDKCSAVQQLLKEAQGVQSQLLSENSSLKFQISSKDLEIDKYQRQLLASDKQDDGCPDALAHELREQLLEERKKCGEEKKKNDNLRELLNEAKQEFEMLIKDREESDTDVSKLHSELLEKVDELAETNHSLETTQQLLSQKSRALDSLEEKYDALAKTHANCEEGLKEISAVLKDHEETLQTVEEIQMQLSSLKVSEGDLINEQPGLEAPKSLLAVTRSLSEKIKTKLSQFKDASTEIASLKSELEISCLSLKQKDDERLDLERKVQKLEQQLEELRSVKEKDVSNSSSVLESMVNGKQDFLESEKCSLEVEVHQLKELLFEKERLREESVSQTKQLQEEAILLQKDLKEMLQKNVRAADELKTAQTELKNKELSISHLERELKSVLQKSNTQLNLSASSQIESENLGSTMQIWNAWKDEANKNLAQVKHELEKVREEKQRFEEELRLKDSELENVYSHRTELLSRYEDSMRKMQEEMEGEKRESSRLRDALYKSTPKKNESAEIRQLKDRIESLEYELSVKKNNEQKPNEQSSAKKVTRSGRKVQQESMSSNESLKENVAELFPIPSSASKPKRTTNTDVKECPSSDSKVKRKDVCVSLPPPQSEGKPQKRNRKLFSKYQTLSVDSEQDEPIEAGEGLPSTCPESYMKRSLRTRKL